MHGIRRSCDSGFREAIIQIGATVTGRGPACREREREASRRFMRKKYFLPPAPRPAGLRESDELEPSKSDSLGNNCGVQAASRDSLWGFVDIELSCHIQKSPMNLNLSAGCPNREKLKMKLSSVDKVLGRTAETSGIPEEKVRNRDATPSDGTFLESVGFISRHPSWKELQSVCTFVQLNSIPKSTGTKKKIHKQTNC